MTLTDLEEHLFASQRVVESSGELLAVPHQQLLVGQDWLDGVEVDVGLRAAQKEGRVKPQM